MTACLLQNNPCGDAAPAYLASKPTTAAVLTALRMAHTAKLNMLAGAAPVQQDSVDLVQLLGQDKTPSVCTEACVSPNGLYMAVCLGTARIGEPYGRGHEYKGVWDPCTSPPPDVQHRKALMMFSLEQGLRRVWSLGDLCRNPVIKWSSDSRLLSAVILKAVPRPEGDGAPPEAFNVVVFDVQGYIVYQLGDNNASYLWFCLCQRGYTEFEWSPSGQYLLVISRSDMMHHGGRVAGCLTVLDVQGDEVVKRVSLLAQCETSVSLLSDCTTPAAWHPGSHCIVVSSGIELKAPERFATAGIILGRLPDKHFIPMQGSARFSFDGQHLVALYHAEVDSGSDEEPAEALSSLDEGRKISVLRCSFSGTSMLLEPIYSHNMVPPDCSIATAAWAPCTPSLRCDLRSRKSSWHSVNPHPDSSFILHFVQQPRSVELEGKSWGYDECFSLSGQLVMSSFGGIYSSETGKLLRPKSDHLPEGDIGRVRKVLPSGRGLVCLNQRIKQHEPCLTTCVLHIIRFA